MADVFQTRRDAIRSNEMLDDFYSHTAVYDT